MTQQLLIGVECYGIPTTPQLLNGVETYDFVVVALLFYVHGKHLRSCRDGQLT